MTGRNMAWALALLLVLITLNVATHGLLAAFVLGWYIWDIAKYWWNKLDLGPRWE